jgi:cyanophycinase
MQRPLGKLLIIGGHEDKGVEEGVNLKIDKKKHSVNHFEILGKLITNVPRAHHIIEIIASASSIPEEMEALYIDSYKKAGFTHVGFIKVENAKEAHDPHTIRRVNGAHAVFFTGGDQLKLTSLLAGTDLMKAIQQKYMADPHFIAGGTSAGAMAIPEIIITGGVIASALYKDDIRMDKGLGLINNIIVDTHFIKRGRFARLSHAVMLHSACLGIGLEEDTAMLISNGHSAECIGSGMIILIDGSRVKSNTALSADSNTPLIVENLNVSIIAEGSFYSLWDRKIIPKP